MSSDKSLWPCKTRKNRASSDAGPVVELTHDTRRLKNKGWNVSDKGVSVKTSQRFNREDYVDATQRCVVCAVTFDSPLNISTIQDIRQSPRRINLRK
jgi:hypothetical protein